MKKPLLLATFGHPGSGKTYFSERLAKQEGYFHLSADRVRHTMFKTPRYTPGEHQHLAEFMDLLAEDMLKYRISVIYDVNFNKRIHRARLPKLAQRSGALFRLVWIQTPEDLALKRIQKRSQLKNSKKRSMYRPIDLAVFNELKNEMEFPAKRENVILIDGRVSFKEQMSQFKRKIRSIATS